MASRRVWLALLLCALLPPSLLAADPAATAPGGTKPVADPAAAAAEAAKTADPKTETGGAKPDVTPAATPKDAAATPKEKTGAGEVKTPPAGTPTGGAAGGAGEKPATAKPPGTPDKATEKPVVPEKPATPKPLPAPSETSSSKATTTSSTSTTTTTLRPPPRPTPTGKCPEPDWNNNTEIEEHVRCKKEKEEKHVLKCAYDPAAAADKEEEMQEKAMKHGRELPVCFLTQDGKRGKKWMYREELAKLTDSPLVCKTMKCEDKILLDYAEYRCFWDDCNEKIEVGALVVACRTKLIKEGIIDKRAPKSCDEMMESQDEAVVIHEHDKIELTTSLPLPKPRGMDEYNEMYKRLKGVDFDDDEESGNHPADRLDEEDDESSSAHHNQFAIVGLLLLWIL